MRILTALLLLFVVLPVYGMTDDAALGKARTLWGPGAMIAKMRTDPAKWEYRVGCRYNGELLTVGKGTSWNRAFAQVNLATNGFLRGGWICSSQLSGITITDP
jgi:hypothetical protein